tara:strand:+ start:265 stop:513 length:249 start_codon:yes stop_codon:yes gene_type:complete
MKYLKVQGNDGLVRDVESNAIINTNNNDYNNYLEQRDRASAKKHEIARQANEINMLKSDINDIKQMLLTLLSASSLSVIKEK